MFRIKAVLLQWTYFYGGLAGASLGLALLWQTVFAIPATVSPGFALHFYQHVIGGLDGRSCPSYPVCSAYAAQAMHKHGILLGSWFLLDRLIHENDDLAQGKWHMYGSERRLYDPLSRNDFWIEE